jgi:hypothetical protein
LIDIVLKNKEQDGRNSCNGAEPVNRAKEVLWMLNIGDCKGIIPRYALFFTTQYIDSITTD